MGTRTAGAVPTVGGPQSDGKEVMVDLPVSLRLKNIGGTDGAGLCVFTSITHSARFQNELGLWDFQKQMSHERGRGYPQKVDQMIAKYAQLWFNCGSLAGVNQSVLRSSLIRGAF
jgi:hypothetical protein